MKILILNWQDIKNPLGGGAEVHLHQIFSRIAKLGHDVTLFCSSFDGALPEETIDGIKVIREGGRYFFNFRVPIKYWKRFRKEKFDIVIDDMNKIPFFTPLYVKERLYFIIHHLFGKSIFLEAPLPFALYVYFMEKLGVAIARRRHVPLFVVSQSTKDEMLTNGFQESNIQFAYNCVDHRLHKPDNERRSKEPLIGYFGRLKKYKSVDHLLKAFTLVRSKFPNVKLVIIGEGDYRKNLESLSKELGVSDVVCFKGYVDEQEKIRLLQEVWFLVNTSSKEGWGLTVIESNACGTPVIGSNVPGLRDAIQDGKTGLLYEYGKIDQLADKILMLLQDSNLRDELARNAYLWSKNFDWDVVAKNVIDELQKSLQDKN